MLRKDYLEKITNAFMSHPITALLGPRQCGKTTLARQYIKSINHAPEINYFDLENPRSLARLNNPMVALENLEGLIVIDEIQRRPDLFQILRVLVDRENNQQTFLILGNASRELIKQSSETLAGRIQYIELTPFSMQEADNVQNLWLNGGFPKSYLANTQESSTAWRESYIQTF